MRPAFNARTAPHVRKDLLLAPERAQIVAAMRLQVQSAWYWAAKFRRLPATIVKFAIAEGIRLRD